MKILAINASHRGERAYTHFLINKLFQGAAGAGAECETIVLAKLKIFGVPKRLLFKPLKRRFIVEARKMGF